MKFRKRTTAILAAFSGLVIYAVAIGHDEHTLNAYDIPTLTDISKLTELGAAAPNYTREIAWWDKSICESVTCGSAQRCLVTPGTVSYDTLGQPLGCVQMGVSLRDNTFTRGSCPFFQCVPMNSVPSSGGGSAAFGLPALAVPIARTTLITAGTKALNKFGEALGEDIAKKEYLQKSWNADGQTGPHPSNYYYFFGLDGK